MPGQKRLPMPSMLQQQSMQVTQNAGMRGPQYPNQTGGVTSPTLNQPSMPQLQQQSPQNGGFSFTQNQLNNVPNPQMIGSMGGMNMNNTIPQQRQLLMLQQQQQQHMRTSGGNANPGMMPPEQYTMVQERMQRMSQAVSPTNAGSPVPMSVSGNDGNAFPVLRSNAHTLPTISRSTLSPSDGTPTPMSPQIPRGSMQDMRRMATPAMGGGGMGGGEMMGGQQMSGFNPQMAAANWQQQKNPQPQQQSMPMGHLQPPNYGVQAFVGGGNAYGNAVPNQTWPGQQYSSLASPTNSFYPQLEQTRQSSSTPGPQQQLQMHPLINSPPAQHTSPTELDLFGWNGQL